MRYTSRDGVKAIYATETIPFKGRTVSGYGGALPTRFMIEYLADGEKIVRKYRVKIMRFGNASTSYITVKGQDLILDYETEEEVSEMHWETRVTGGN